MKKISVNHDFMIYSDEEKESALQCLSQSE